MERRKTCALSSLKIFNAIMRSESTLLYIGFLIYLLINHTFPHCSSNFLFLTALKMSSTSSKNSLFSIEPYTLSNNSLFSIEEYNHGANQMSQHEESKSDAGKSHASFISIDEFNSGDIHRSEDVQASERVDSSSDGVCVNKPIHFRRIPRQVSLRRYNFLCSDRQIAFDTSKHAVGIYASRNLERRTSGGCDRNICPLTVTNKILT